MKKLTELMDDKQYHHIDLTRWDGRMFHRRLLETAVILDRLFSAQQWLLRLWRRLMGLFKRKSAPED